MESSDNAANKDKAKLFVRRGRKATGFMRDSRVALEGGDAAFYLINRYSIKNHFSRKEVQK